MTFASAAAVADHPITEPAPGDSDWSRHVWRADACESGAGVAAEAGRPTGHAALDAELPGGGWAAGNLIELLPSRPGGQVWRLLLPALTAHACGRQGPVVIVGAPHEPYAPALAAGGLAAERLLWIRVERPAARLWATEQALRCAEVGAVLAWLPRVRSADLWRLHLAAGRHRRLLFVLREPSAASEPSPARLRLLVEGVEAMTVRVLKRRGPPALSPIDLAAHGDALAALIAARGRARRGAVPAKEAPSTQTPSFARRARVASPGASASAATLASA